MNSKPDIKTLEIILSNLVTEPEKINIQRSVDELGVLLKVQVAETDMGIVIGRGGVMANSIKTIMKAVGKANNMNIRIQFLEPDGSLKYTTGNNYSDSDNGDSIDSDINELVIE